MAHNVETMAYAGKTPWHGLGTKVIDDMTPDEMLVQAGLDWEVEKRPMFYSSDMFRKEVKGKQALVRKTDDSLLDVVGDDWIPVQNREALSFFDEFCKAGEMKMDTAGSLQRGRYVWALASIQEGFTLPGEDRVEGYLLFSNPHVYGVKIDVMFTPIRVVCNNTLNIALDLAAKNRFRKTHRSAFSAQEAKEFLGLARNQFQLFEENCRMLAAVKMTEEQLDDYLMQLFPANGEDKVSRVVEQALAIFESQPGANMSHGSFWHAYNTVTYLTDHVVGRAQESRMHSAWFGDRAKLKQRAFTLATNMAEAA